MGERPPTTYEIGARIRAARRRAGLTQAELAFAGCTNAHVSRIERGLRRASPRVLRELAERIGTSYDDLVAPVRRDDLVDSRLVDAELALRLDDVARARGLYEAILEECGNAEQRIEALEGLGKVEWRGGDLEAALPLLEDARDVLVSLGRAVGDRPGLAEALARVYAAIGELAPAIAVLEECVAAYERTADVTLYVRFAALLGYALTDANDLRGAERVVARALRRGASCADAYTRSRLYWSQSRLLLEEGRSDLAERYARKTLETLRVTEDAYAIAHAHETLAHIYTDLGRPEAAVEALDRARPVLEATGTPLDLAHFRIEEARAAAALGDGDRAAAVALQALGALGGALPAAAARGFLLVAGVYDELGDRERAKELYELAFEELVARCATRYAVEAASRLSRLLKEEGRTAEALDVLERAVALSVPGAAPREPEAAR